MYKRLDLGKVRIISGKAAECRLFWIENEKGLWLARLSLAKNYVNKVIDTSRISDGMIVIEVLVLGIIVSVMSHNLVEMIARTMISIFLW